MDDSARRRMEFAAHLRPRLLSFALTHADSREDAEDAVSMATERVVAAPVDDPRQVEAWLYTTTERACFEQRRRARVSLRTAVRLTTATDVEDPADRVCHRAEVSWFADRLGRLPKHLRRTAEILGQGGTYHDVARDLGVTERAARHYIEDTKARLRRIVASTRAGIAALAHRVQELPRRVAAELTPLWEALTSALVVAGIAGALSVLAPTNPPRPHHDLAARAAPSETLDLTYERRRSEVDGSSVDATASPNGGGTRRAGNDDVNSRAVQDMQGRTARLALDRLPPAARRPAEDKAGQGRHGRSGGQGTPDYDDPPLHEWVIWCLTHAEVHPGSNNLCPQSEVGEDGHPTR